MDIVITGAAGFVGINLCKALLTAGHSVYGLDKASIHPRLKVCLQHPNFQYVEVDVSHEKPLLSVLTGIQEQHPIAEVWHLAANSDIAAGVANPDIDLKDTFLTTHALLKCMKILHIPKLMFASSSAIYGEHKQLLKEETGPLSPISHYGAMKLASEGLISAACEAYLKQAYIFRFPNVVGAPATHGVIYDFVRKLKQNNQSLQVLGNGKQQKPYLHINDLVAAMQFIVQRAHNKINYFNIGPLDTGISVKQIAELVVNELAPHASVHYGDTEKGWVGDVSQFNYCQQKLQQLGWTPRLTSLSAIQLAIKEIIAHQESFA